MDVAFEPLSLEFQADPYATYHALRAADPVHDLGVADFHLLTRHADVEAALTDPRLGAFTFDTMRIFAPEASGAEGPLAGTLRHWLILSDPPTHTRLRALVSRAFAPRAIERLRPSIGRLVEAQLDRVTEAGHMDVMADMARVLPVAVIATLLGVPAEDHERFRRWTERLAMALDPRFVWTSREDGERAVAEMHDYLGDLAEERRRHPRGDLLSGLLASDEAGDRLARAEVLATVTLLLFAGSETTANLIGNGIAALLAHPGELARLAADPALMPSAVEEFLRYDSPVQCVIRVVGSAVDYGAKTIPAGQRLVLAIAAANRDPARFPDPDRLDVGRDARAHLAFGAGIHFCLGAALARLEAGAAIAGMLRRLRHVRPAEPGPQRRPTLLLRGFESLPIEFEPVR